MKSYNIQFHLISETGYETTLTFEECYEININDRTFEFTDVYSGYRYVYYLKDIPDTQSAKVIDNIIIKENEVN